MKRMLEWRNCVLSLLQKLPQYNEKDFYFEILERSPPNYDGLYYFVENDTFCTCSYERGKVSGERYTDNIEEAVYWVLHDVTRSYVYEWEYRNRVRYTDTRRQWMKVWQELFDIIGQPYNDMIREYIHAVLQKAPFDDAACSKLDLFEDYERIAALLKDTAYYNNPALRGIIDKNLSVYRGEYGGIHDFDDSFEQIKKDTHVIKSFLLKEKDKTEVKEILRLIEHTENIVQKYLLNISENDKEEVTNDK